MRNPTNQKIMSRPPASGEKSDAIPSIDKMFAHHVTHKHQTPVFYKHRGLAYGYHYPRIKWNELASSL